MSRIKEEPDELPDLQPAQTFTQINKLIKKLKKHRTNKPPSSSSYYVGQRLAKDFMSPFTGRVVATPSSSNRY